MRHLKPISRPKLISFKGKRPSKKAGQSPRAAMEIRKIIVRRQFCNVPAALLLAAFFPDTHADSSRLRVPVGSGRSVAYVESLERRMLLMTRGYDGINSNDRG